MKAPPIQFLLIDTGERRYPQGDEHYFYLPEPGAVYNAEGFDGEYAGAPEDFGILRLVTVPSGDQRVTAEAAQ